MFKMIFLTAKKFFFKNIFKNMSFKLLKWQNIYNLFKFCPCITISSLPSTPDTS